MQRNDNTNALQRYVSRLHKRLKGLQTRYGLDLSQESAVSVRPQERLKPSERERLR